MVRDRYGEGNGVPTEERERDMTGQCTSVRQDKFQHVIALFVDFPGENTSGL